MSQLKTAQHYNNLESKWDQYDCFIPVKLNLVHFIYF